MISDYKIDEERKIWKINDIDLAITDGGRSFMKKFIEQYRHEEYSLSLFDQLSNRTIEIEAKLQDMPDIVSEIYNIEHAAPLYFIGDNELTKSYVVGMNMAKGIIEFGNYIYENGKLNKK